MFTRRQLLFASLSALVTPSAGHAILVSPTPRPNQVGVGTKLTPFSNARRQANGNQGCGGANNLDPGVQIPQAAYRPGEIVRVEWQLTIPHPVDNLDTGIRIAIHYGPDDSFEQNVLIGGVDGDPNFDDDTGDGIIDRALPAAQDNTPTNGIVSTIVTLPAGKICNYCTLQWVWAARQDGGFYMGCADISITNTGLLPDFNLLAPETGNELPQNNPNQNPGGGGGANGSDSGGGGNGWVVVVILLLLVATGAGGYYYWKQNNEASSKSGYGPAVPPARPPGGGGPPSLPPGWTAAVDPASGRTYYSNAMTNETSWEPPMAPAPPAGTPPMPQVANLPPGWSEAKDEASGRMYYINNTTGASTWEKPTNRF